MRRVLRIALQIWNFSCPHRITLFPILYLFFVILPFPVQAEEPIIFKMDYGDILVGPIVSDDGKGTLKVSIINKTECDFTDLSLTIEYITGELSDGTPSTWEDTFLVPIIKIGETKIATKTDFVHWEGSQYKILNVTKYDSERYCQKEEEEKIRKEKEEQVERERIAEESARIISEEKNRAKGAKNKYKTLGFKGLHLGMERKDLDALLKHDRDFLWGISAYSSIDGDYVKLDCLNDNMCRIGCEGKGESEKCYEIDSVAIEFYKNKISRIIIGSLSYNASDIDPYIQGWAKFAMKGLSDKYGKPTKIPKPADRFNIFSFRTNYYMPMYIWHRGKSSISVCGSSSEFKYKVVILFDDETALKVKAEEERKHRKTEF